MANVKLGTKAVGSIVKIKVNGASKDFIVVQQGNPNTSTYDSSCNGTWLLMKDIYTTSTFGNDNSYKDSSIHTYLNGTFYNLIDSDIRAAIKQVKIPYQNGTGSGGSLATGSNGLSTKVFLLSGYEVGWTTSDNGYFPKDGAKLDYFGSGSGGNSKRIAYNGSSAAAWWLRSPSTGSTGNVWLVDSDGSGNFWYCSHTYGVRPAFVLPSELVVSDDGTVSTNTAPAINASSTNLGEKNAPFNFGYTVTDADGNKAFAYGDAEPQPARTDPTESLNRSLTKTGGTPFTAEKITVEMDGGPWFIPGSAVNELRREALDALLKKRETLRPWPTTEEHVAALPQRTLPPRRTLRARFERWEQVPERALDGVEYLILPIAQADRVPREWRAKTLLELPRVMFGALEQDTARRIAATQDAGFAGYEVSNIAHLRLCRGLPMTGGFGLNITNNVAAQFYAEQGLSSLLILPEVKDSDIASIAPTRNGKPVPTGVMIYGHMPLMLTRACPLQNIHDCAHCDKTGVLTDRKAKKFPVRCGLGVRTIYNPVPIYMGDKPGALAVDYGVAYFTLESREEAAQILDSIRTHAPFEGDFTRGLYFKGTN